MNDSKPRDWCRQCLPELSTTSWSERKGKNALLTGFAKMYQEYTFLSLI